jgi:hypothetical protein
MVSSTHSNGKAISSQQTSRPHSSKESSTAGVQFLGHDTVQRAYYAPGTLTPTDVIALQRSMGNQAVQRMLANRVQPSRPVMPVGAPPSRGQMIQPKLAVGPVGDKYEQEADRVAKQVVDMPAPVQRQEEQSNADNRKSVVQRNAENEANSANTPVKQRLMRVSEAEEEEDEELQRKPLIQRSGKGGFEVDGDFEGSLKSSKGGGAPLPDTLRADFEPKFGADFGGVKVHTDAHADQLNRSIQAKAFTSGSDIFFSKGQYNPSTSSGQQLIAHELTHTVQQGAAVQTKRASTGLKGAVSARTDAPVERQEDGTGANDVQMMRDSQGAAHSTLSQQTETTASPIPTFLKTPRSDGSGNTPIQRRFGFEIEIPMLFTCKKDFTKVPAHGYPAPNPMPKQNLKDVPADPVHKHHRETDLYNIPGVDAHVNVDHNGSLDPLYRRELFDVYATNKKHLSVNRKNGLKLFTGKLVPSQAPIMEVVTDAWDEHALTPDEARLKFEAVVNWVNDRFDDIDHEHQAPVGDYYIGSEAQYADHFQPRLGYFHATYGVKLHQVPELFRQTTQQKDTLTTYAQTHTDEAKHADNLNRTFSSIAMAQTALAKIKSVWPKTGGGFFKQGKFHKKGVLGWTPDTEAAFLGFITLLDNYLIMFQSGSTDNLGKNKVGMHYYKSDLFDLASQLPAQIINVLQTNANVRKSVIEAIGKSVGLKRKTALTGPMAGWSLQLYLDQIFRGTLGPIAPHPTNVNLQNIHDPLLRGSINPWSTKLGPDQVGPGTNRELGVVMENRHLEYLDPNYGANTTQSETQQAQEHAQYGPQNTGRSEEDIAKDESTIARLQGPAKRPIGEWVTMMTNIYNMLRTLNA